MRGQLTVLVRFGFCHRSVSEVNSLFWYFNWVESENEKIFRTGSSLIYFYRSLFI